MLSFTTQSLCEWRGMFLPPCGVTEPISSPLIMGSMKLKLSHG